MNLNTARFRNGLCMEVDKMNVRINNYFWIVLLFGMAWMVGCVPAAEDATASVEQPALAATAVPVEPTAEVEMANPAAAFCVEQGYEYRVATADDGSQAGVCVFAPGDECDGWAYFRGECGPTAVPTVTVSSVRETAVTGWLGYVITAPDGADTDDILILQPEGAGTVSLSGATESVENEIIALRDKPEPGRQAHFWGTLTCGQDGQPDCHLSVSQLRVGPTNTEPESISDWEGILVSNPECAQFDDYFLLAGDFPVGFGIHSLDEAAAQTLVALRDTGEPFRVWGQLRCGVPDAFGSQIEVTRLERE